MLFENTQIKKCGGRFKTQGTVLCLPICLELLLYGRGKSTSGTDCERIKFSDNQEAVAKATASFIYKRFDKSEFEVEPKLVYRRGRRPRRPAYLHTNRTNIYHVSLRLQRVVEDCTV